MNTSYNLQNAFHGPQLKFGKLLFIQMCDHKGHHSDVHRERITFDQFLKSGKEILKLYDEADELKYFFHLFSESKDTMCREGKKKCTCTVV